MGNEINSYCGVGEIQFGMKESQIYDICENKLHKVVGKYTDEYKLFWQDKGICIICNKQGECVAIEGNIQDQQHGQFCDKCSKHCPAVNSLLHESLSSVNPFLPLFPSPASSSRSSDPAPHPLCSLPETGFSVSGASVSDPATHYNFQCKTDPV